MKAFGREFLRSISRSKGRFIAIAVIAALGTGFFAGLQMTAPDMRLAADQYYDGTNDYDIRVTTTLGVDDEMIEELSEIEGVETVVPERETDVAAVVGNAEYSLRVHSLDIEAAAESDTSDQKNAISDDDEYVNRPILVEGSWPSGSGECVIGYDTVFDTPVEIGDQITFVKMADDSDLGETFETCTYTVTGFVRSSYYVCISDLGTTTLGDGWLDDFIYIPEDDFVQSNPYSGAFVIVEGAADELSGSDAYQAVVDEVEDRISGVETELVTGRYERFVSEAQETIDDATAEYEDVEAEADLELADAWQQLVDADSELSEAEATLASSKEQLEDAEDQISAGASELESSAEELAGYEEQYETALAEYEEQSEAVYAELDAQQEELDEAAAELEEQSANLAAYESQLEQVEAGIEEAEAAIEALTAQIEALEATDPGSAQLATLEEQLAALEEQLSTLESQQSQLESAIAAIESAQEELDSYQAELDAAREQADSELAAAWEELEEAAAQIEAARAELAAGEEELESSRQQVADGWEEYYAGLSEYEEGLSEYESGLAEYEEAEDEAGIQLSDAWTQIEDAQAELDGLETPTLYQLDRTLNVGSAGFNADAGRIANIATVFPLIFFLVAALVSLTTMTRMVDEERSLIGTYKALGYSNGKIISKYLLYALIATLIGSIVGILVLTQFLPYFIMNAYAIIYKLPDTPTPIDPGIAIGATLLCVGIVLAATWWAAATSLRETPAALMLPRAPKAGKRILIERIKPFWNRLSFLWKVTCRNIFRYKKRFVMALIGIAGCTALLLTGFGLSDSINDILSKQYEADDSLFRYNFTVMLEDGITDGELEAIEDELDSDESITSYTKLHLENVVASTEDYGNQGVTLTVPTDPEGLEEFVTLVNRTSGEELELSDGHAIISEKIAKRLGVEVGDEFTLYEQDEVGNPTGSGYTFTVGGICECYVSNYVYVTESDFEAASGEPVDVNYIYMKDSGGDDEQGDLAATLLDLDGISIVSPTDDIVAYYRDALKSIDSIVWILIISAAALAFVVVYNLTNINIEEREREIATLKVLGFNKREVNDYIFRETMILAVLGALIGLVAGIFLCNFVVQTAEVDQVMFGRQIHAMSFLTAFVLTIVFAAIVSIFMRKKLENISMVESLKSVD